MSLWLTQVLDPGMLLRHIAMFLVVAAVAMPAIGLVRWLGLAAGIVGIVGASVIAYDPGNLFWWILLAIVAVLRIGFATGWRVGAPLSRDEEMFHQRIVPELNAGHVRLLLTAGRWREVVPGTALTRAGERIVELCFIARGQVDIVVDGKKVGDSGAGTLIGEAGLSTGDVATADAICSTSVRYLGFDATRLYRLLDNHEDLQDAIELAIERSLRDKLHRSNMAAAHPGQPAR
jgi:Cyclic nucleotide-binding domain